jgi:fatty acid desaturase
MIKMLNIKFFDREKIRTEIVKQEAKRYIITAVILIAFTGFFWPIILILLPFIWAFIWFLVFKFIFHEKLARASRLL